MNRITKCIGVFILIASLFIATSCGKKTTIVELDQEMFTEACISALECEREDIEIQRGRNYSYYFYEDELISIRLWIYDNKNDSRSIFESFYYSSEKLQSESKFDGKMELVLEDKKGYVLLDGMNNEIDSYIYGGVYYTGSMLLNVRSVSDNKEQKSTIDAFLRKINFPGY